MSIMYILDLAETTFRDASYRKALQNIFISRARPENVGSRDETSAGNFKHQSGTFRCCLAGWCRYICMSIVFRKSYHLHFFVWMPSLKRNLVKQWRAEKFTLVAWYRAAKRCDSGWERNESPHCVCGGGRLFAICDKLLTLAVNSQLNWSSPLLRLALTDSIGWWRLQKCWETLGRLRGGPGLISLHAHNLLWNHRSGVPRDREHRTRLLYKLALLRKVWTLLI